MSVVIAAYPDGSAAAMNEDVNAELRIIDTIIRLTNIERYFIFLTPYGFGLSRLFREVASRIFRAIAMARSFH